MLMSNISRARIDFRMQASGFHTRPLSHSPSLRTHCLGKPISHVVAMGVKQCLGNRARFSTWVLIGSSI